jgi:alpha-L-rhamnosidase
MMNTVNVLGVLYDVIPRAEQQGVLQQVMGIAPGTTSGGILSSSYYFRFYLARALDHAGMADQYLASLKPWRDLLPLHFSTWPETPGKTRSDSHAWSAHPAYDLLTLVAGIERRRALPRFALRRTGGFARSVGGVSACSRYDQGVLRASRRCPDGPGRSASWAPGCVRVAGERAGVAHGSQ